MSELGIYFGPKQIDITEVKSRRLANNVSLGVSEITGNELDEKVPAEIKITAAFNDIFRRNKIEAKESVLCLSGRDLIIRTFEIPVLPKEEMQSAINFEAKKYIPFKVEDLISDYQLEMDKVSRTNMVLYMGIKKDTYNKYVSVFNQLNIKLKSIEYAGFSILKYLKLSGVKDSGVIGVICADSQSKDEVNFVVLENGFPLFTRDISLSSGADDLDKIPETDSQVASIDKLKSELKVSLDYYRRKFPTKGIKNLIIICGQDWRFEIENYSAELGLSSKFVDFAKVVGKPVSYSSSFAKSYSAAIFKTGGIKIGLDLIESKSKSEKVVKSPIEVASIFKGFRLDLRFIVAALLICAGTFLYGFFQKNPFEQELELAVGSRVQVPGVPSSSSLESLKSISSKYKKTLENLDNLIKNQLYITETMDIVPRVLPQGLWLTKFSFNSKDGESDLNIEGMSYLGDGDKEFQAVNDFLNSLNSSAVFSKYFKSVNIAFIDRAEFARQQVTKFSIKCKTAVKPRK